MRWKSHDIKAWHRWFAWYPVQTEDGQSIWLERVERKLFWVPLPHGRHIYRYRTIGSSYEFDNKDCYSFLKPQEPPSLSTYVPKFQESQQQSQQRFVASQTAQQAAQNAAQWSAQNAANRSMQSCQ